MASLSRALKTALSMEFQHCRGDMSFNTEVIVVEDFNPTTNDNQALKVCSTLLIVLLFKTCFRFNNHYLYELRILTH